MDKASVVMTVAAARRSPQLACPVRPMKRRGSRITIARGTNRLQREAPSGLWAEVMTVTKLDSWQPMVGQEAPSSSRHTWW
jgi:hypothetical protein